MTRWTRDEIDEAYHHFVATGDSQDWDAWADLHSEDGVHRFGCVTILEYAGDGLWSYQEDLYNPREGEAVVKRWLAAGGKL